MRSGIIGSLLFLSIHLHAQLKLFPLVSDPSRQQTTILRHSLKSNLRLEAVQDTVKPSVVIKLIKGNNPRCNADTATLTFKAIPLNGGTSPTFMWQVGSGIVNGDSLFSSKTLTNGQVVNCTMTSGLSCVKPAFAVSHSDTIRIDTAINPSLSILVQGLNPACFINTPVTFVGVPNNAGANPAFSWYYKDTLRGIGPSITYDSLAGNASILCIMTVTSPTLCSSPNIQYPIIVKDSASRSVHRIIVPSVSLNILGVTSYDCSNKYYNFQATPSYFGLYDTTKWFINNALVYTSLGFTFSTQIAQNGDQVTVELASSLPCAIPSSVVSNNNFQKADTIRLPFFEDFSGYTGQPSNDKWIKFGGTYINNTYPITPPNYNTATFDGLKYNGVPYDTTSALTRGKTDNLTSLPLDISAFNNSGNIYLSFFFQAQGLGDRPESTQGDNIALYFKNSLNQWISVWEMAGDSTQTTVAPFQEQILPIINDTINNYFHPGFQFKFQSTGRLSGTFDAWNIDYIYLNKGRSASDLYFPDQGFSQTPSSLLKPYSSVPIKHFIANPSRFLQDSLTTSINNLDNKFNIIRYSGILITDSLKLDSLSSKTQIKIDTNTSSNIISLATLHISGKPKTVPGFINLQAKPTLLTTIYSLSGDLNNSDNKEIDYTANNTITAITILDNFYAYDDGSAEFGIGLNQKYSMLAYRFVTDATYKDSLKQIAIAYNRLGRPITEPHLTLFVTKSRPVYADLVSSTLPGYIYYRDSATIRYSHIINNFTIYDLGTPIPIVSDTFYVGYIQLLDESVVIGWDRNTNSSSNIFYYLSADQGWLNYNDGEGSLMIRPVFGNYHYLLDTKKDVAQKNINFKIYPNPVSDKIYLRPSFTKLTLYDLLGEEKANYINSDEVDVSIFPEGMYLLKIYNEDGSGVSKLIIKK